MGKDFGTTKNYSEKIAEQIDAEVYKFVMSGYERAIKILEANKDKLIFIAEYLVKNEIMDAEQFELCFIDGVTESMLDEVATRKKKAAADEDLLRKAELENQKKVDNTVSEVIDSDTINEKIEDIEINDSDIFSDNQ